MLYLKTVLLLIGLLSVRVENRSLLTNEVEDECNLPLKLIEEIESYGPIVNKIINETTNGSLKGVTYNELAKFVDKFGPRLSGTKNLEDSIDYMLNLLKQYELDNVHGEEVPVPHWERGSESAKLLQPRETNLPVLGLGSTIPTPDEGITAEAIVVTSFDELNTRNDTEGKIIVYNNEYVSYGVSVQYRSQGASKASEKGAVAALVRSVGPFSMSTLHTGSQSYASGVTKIPVASITIEDARMLQRLQDRGEKIVIQLNLSSTAYNNSISRNTVAEVEGSTYPEKVVIVSGHLDSWDVGVGAMDDGGGSFISWMSLVVLKRLGLQPKRTVRSILWTAEEPGLWGVIGYNATHADELGNFTFVMESDIGTFTPRGLTYTAGATGACIIKEILKLLAPINATESAYESAAGSDITIWTGDGIPGASLYTWNERYFWYHHTPADTMDVENPDDLDKATALWTAASYIIADLSIDFPRELKRNPQYDRLLKVFHESIEANKDKRL